MRYSGVADAVQRMWRAEGLTGFFRGMTVKLYQTVLAAALMMMLKEVRLMLLCGGGEVVGVGVGVGGWFGVADGGWRVAWGWGVVWGFGLVGGAAVWPTDQACSSLMTQPITALQLPVLAHSLPARAPSNPHPPLQEIYEWTRTILLAPAAAVGAAAAGGKPSSLAAPARSGR